MPSGQVLKRAPSPGLDGTIIAKWDGMTTLLQFDRFALLVLFTWFASCGRQDQSLKQPTTVETTASELPKTVGSALTSVTSIQSVTYTRYVGSWFEPIGQAGDRCDRGTKRSRLLLGDVKRVEFESCDGQQLVIESKLLSDEGFESLRTLLGTFKVVSSTACVQDGGANRLELSNGVETQLYGDSDVSCAFEGTPLVARSFLDSFQKALVNAR